MFDMANEIDYCPFLGMLKKRLIESCIFLDISWGACFKSNDIDIFCKFVIFFSNFGHLILYAYVFILCKRFKLWNLNF